MHDLLSNTVLGLSTTAIFALAASGLVLTYTTTGVFNFAHGAIGMLGAFSYWQLHVAWGWPVPLALAGVLLVGAPALGLLIERGFVDPGGDTNGSPTMWEFHEFLCRHPEVRAIGFVASTLEGIDAVASLETVYAETISPALRRDARSFCRTTPERTLRGHLECFWD